MCRKGSLYCVGLASDLKRRLGAHLKDRHMNSWDQGETVGQVSTQRA
jgi:predicted GIY-YIG superfamily endonuclease